MESINSITEEEVSYIDSIIETQLCNPTRFNISKWKHRIMEYGFCPCDINEDGEPLKATISYAVTDEDGNPDWKEEHASFSPEEQEEHRKEYWIMNDEFEDTFLMFKSLRPYANKYPEEIGGIKIQPVGIASDTTATMNDIQETLDNIHGISEQDREQYNMNLPAEESDFTFIEWEYINEATIQNPHTKDTKLLTWFKNEGKWE